MSPQLTLGVKGFYSFWTKISSEWRKRSSEGTRSAGGEKKISLSFQLGEGCPCFTGWPLRNRETVGHRKVEDDFENVLYAKLWEVDKEAALCM